MKTFLWTTLLSLFCLTLSAKSFTVNELEYEEFYYFEGNTQKIAVKLTGTSNLSLTALNVPAQVEFEGVTYNVLKIGWQAFRRANFQTITFAEGLEEIEDEAFLQATIGDGIRQKVVFPKSLRKIGRRAFYQASNFLFDEDSLNPLLTLGDECFHQSKWHNDKLAGREDVIYAGKIIYGALPTATAISQVREGTLSIVDAAFKQHPNLQSVTLPGTIKIIPKEAFSACPKLQSVEIGEGTEMIGQSAFNGCSALNTLTLPNSIKLIWWWAFSNCKELGNITLPSQLEIIGNNAFESCTKLDIVGKWPKGLTQLGDSPNGCVFKNCTQLKSVSIGDNVKDIYDETFFGCTALTTVNLPARLREIGQSAFADCSALETCRFPDSLAVIGPNAFLNCTKFDVDEKNIADSVLLGANCFKNTVWYNQQPGNVLYLGTRLVGVKTDDRGNAFKLTNVEIKPGTTHILPAAFFGQDQLTQVTIPDEVKMIDEYAFFQCSAIGQVTLPAHLKELKTYAFAGCQPLHKLELPKELEYIGANAMNSTSITSLTIPKSVTRVDSLALAGMPFLKELVIEDSKSMGGYPFYVDYSLTEIASAPPTSTAPSVANLAIYQEGPQVAPQVAIKVFKKGTATLNTPIPPEYSAELGENYPLTIRVDMPSIVVPDGWNTPAAGTYKGRTAIYARIGSDEIRPKSGDMIAAFINNECRDTYAFTGQNSSSINQKPLPYEVATLNVWSSQEEVDAQTPITFQISRQGVVYKVMSTNTTDIMTNLQTYGTPDSPVLFDLPVVLTGLQLRLADPTLKELEVEVGNEVNLSRTFEIIPEPKNATLPEGMTWSAGNSSNFTIQGDMLTAVSPSPDGYEFLYLNYRGYNTATQQAEDMMASFDKLLITPKRTSVTGIELISPTAPKVDALVNVPFTIDFRVLPVNATNKDVTLSQDANDLLFGPVTSKEVPNEFSVTVTPRNIGTYNMHINTVDGNYTLTLNVTVKARYESATLDRETAVYFVNQTVPIPTINVTPTEPAFDPSFITDVRVVTTDVTQPQITTMYTPSLCEVKNEGTNWLLLPKRICEKARLEIYISGMPQPVCQTVDFKKVYSYDKGWSWISVPYTYDFLNSGNDRNLIEMRSSTKMAYNDATYGWFGTWFELEQGQAYKQNAVSGTSYQIAYQPAKNNFEQVTLNKGWNWIGVPYDYDYSINMIMKDRVLPQQKGDMILSQHGAYLCDGSSWQSSLQGDNITLHTGEGYLYLSTAENSVIRWGAPYAGPIYAQHMTQGTKGKEATSPWSYDVNKYSSAMAVVGKMTQNFAHEHEQYSIGAFVGDECRGEGRVLDNGLLFISANGEPGETVRFVLYDQVTNEYADFETALKFTRMAGTIDQPVLFSLKNETTGVNGVQRDGLNLRFEGDEIKMDGNYAFSVYTAEGKLVSNQGLVPGMYIVVVHTHDGPVTQKLIKK